MASVLTMPNNCKNLLEMMCLKMGTAAGKQAEQIGLKCFWFPDANGLCWILKMISIKLNNGLWRRHWKADWRADEDVTELVPCIRAFIVLWSALWWCPLGSLTQQRQCRLCLIEAKWIGWNVIHRKLNACCPVMCICGPGWPSNHVQGL